MSSALEQVNELERKAMWATIRNFEDALKAFDTRLKALKNENIDLWDFVFALSDDVARHNLIEKKQSEESEQKTEFVQIGGQNLRISPYKVESKTVSWKDFEDFLDDNAEDFDSIGKRLDVLERKLNILMRIEDHEHQNFLERLGALEERIGEDGKCGEDS